MRSFKLTVNPFQRKLLLVVGGDKDKILKAISKHRMGRELRSAVSQDPPDPTEEACVYTDDKYGRFLLYFPKWGNKDCMSTLTHECHHIVKDIMTHIGENKAKETPAYLQEWLIKELKKLLQKTK